MFSLLCELEKGEASTRGKPGGGQCRRGGTSGKERQAAGRQCWQRPWAAGLGKRGNGRRQGGRPSSTVATTPPIPCPPHLRVPLPPPPDLIPCPRHWGHTPPARIVLSLPPPPLRGAPPPPTPFLPPTRGVAAAGGEEAAERREPRLSVLPRLVGGNHGPRPSVPPFTLPGQYGAANAASQLRSPAGLQSLRPDARGQGGGTVPPWPPSTTTTSCRGGGGRPRRYDMMSWWWCPQR